MHRCHSPWLEAFLLAVTIGKRRYWHTRACESPSADRRAGGCRFQPSCWDQALLEYARDRWQGAIVQNEVYPEPSAAEIAELEARGAHCYHIVGVEGRAWPPFPRAYRGGIPCCASLPFSPDDPDSDRLSFSLRRGQAGWQLLAHPFAVASLLRRCPQLLNRFQGHGAAVFCGRFSLVSL